MRALARLAIPFVVLALAATSRAAAPNGFDPLPWTRRTAVAGKNFPLFAMIERHPAAKETLRQAPPLRALFESKRARATRAASDCGLDLQCHADAFSWNADEEAIARTALKNLAVGDDAAVGTLVDAMRASGMFEDGSPDGADVLLTRAWDRSVRGLNGIIAVYGLGLKPRYPTIDAVSYDVTANPYRMLVNTAVGALDEQREEWSTFYEPGLAFALKLLDINWRDEAGRFEPLHLGENAAAYQRIGDTPWARYRYTVIVVPGAGPDRPGVALDAQAKLRIELAARRYHQGLAPFLLVSGGFVHPNQTAFNEALEMKRSLIRDFDVPEQAILVDPHARHTTTNLRNAARLMYRYGIPTDRPSLITTDAYQSDYIAGAVFAERCDRELGYRPYTLGERVSRFDLEWRPRVQSLLMDPADPLDP
jgi:hypothetical protein